MRNRNGCQGSTQNSFNIRGIFNRNSAFSEVILATEDAVYKDQYF